MNAFQIGARVFEGPGPFLMGVVNVTPESFSDGGLHAERDAAVAGAERLLAEGADLVDVGGESTRPGAQEVPADEELRRVVPVVAALRARGCTAPLSVDTRKAVVARAALEGGADLVNHVSALADPALAELGAQRGAPGGRSCTCVGRPPPWPPPRCTAAWSATWRASSPRRSRARWRVGCARTASSSTRASASRSGPSTAWRSSRRCRACAPASGG